MTKKFQKNIRSKTVMNTKDLPCLMPWRLGILLRVNEIDQGRILKFLTNWGYNIHYYKWKNSISSTMFQPKTISESFIWKLHITLSRIFSKLESTLGKQKKKKNLAFFKTIWNVLRCFLQKETTTRLIILLRSIQTCEQIFSSKRLMPYVRSKTSFRPISILFNFGSKRFTCLRSSDTAICSPDLMYDLVSDMLLLPCSLILCWMLQKF